jgi:hypothetical protein
MGRRQFYFLEAAKIRQQGMLPKKGKWGDRGFSWSCGTGFWVFLNYL